jgi:hypothetical protein
MAERDRNFAVSTLGIFAQLYDCGLKGVERDIRGVHVTCMTIEALNMTGAG